MKKTNAVRILDQHHITYKLLVYDVDINDLSAGTVAEKVGKPVEQVFKTLLLRGDKSGIVVAVVPGNAEVSLKSLAALSGNKKCTMLPLKEIQPATGYIRGGVSPLGMKKNFPVYIDDSALLYDNICVSAGIRGLQIEIHPEDLIRVTRATSGKITE